MIFDNMCSVYTSMLEITLDYALLTRIQTGLGLSSSYMGKSMIPGQIANTLKSTTARVVSEQCSTYDNQQSTIISSPVTQLENYAKFIE